MLGARPGDDALQSTAGSNGVGAPFTGAHPDHGVDGADPHLAVTDLAGAGGLDDDVDHLVDGRVVDDDLDPHLRHEVDGVLRTAVDLGVALLPAVALHLADRHPEDARLLETGLDVLERERLDDRSDQLHVPHSSVAVCAARVPNCDRPRTKSYAVSACSASSMPAASSSSSSRSPMVNLRMQRQDSVRRTSRPAPRTHRPPVATAGRSRRRRTGPSTAAGASGVSEQADQQGADQTADQVHADDVERVVEAQLELQPDGQRADAHRATQPIGQGAEHVDRRAGRGDGDQAGHDARRRAQWVAWPSRIRSTSSQPSIAAAVATVVLTKVDAGDATGAERRAGVEAEPAEPQQAGAEHARTAGCAAASAFPASPALAEHEASARPAAPALMCTAVPPAKSIALSLLAIQPPCGHARRSRRRRTPSARPGSRRTSPTAPAKTSQVPNFSRSATAPEIRATVMIANISWNATNTSCGMVPASGMSTRRLGARTRGRVGGDRGCGVAADEPLETEELRRITERRRRLSLPKASE